MAKSSQKYCFSVKVFVALCTLYSLSDQTTAQNAITGESLDISNYLVPTSEVFLWASSPWGDCQLARADSCCERRCERTRQVKCIKAANGKTAADYYCQAIGQGSEKPPSTEPCSNCTEDCVLSTWSKWSGCSASCGHATEFRSRRVLRAPVGLGQKCGVLSEFRVCEKLAACPVPVYTWKIGPWTSCRQINGSSSSQCGVGQRSRAIGCIDDKGHEVDQSQCLLSVSGASTTKPVSAEACDSPCDCALSTWGRWSECSQTCGDETETADTAAFQTRVRKIVVLPEYGGSPCPSMIEKRLCDMSALPRCPGFRWHAEAWGDCHVTLLEAEGACGAGQQRRQVYCVGDDHGRQPVEDTFCLKEMAKNSSYHKPPSHRACQVPCPQDCQLGNWGNWSPCSQSCGHGGHKVRSREVLVRAAHGGVECGPLTQSTRCEPVDCVWWHTGRWSKCFLDYGYYGCGLGSQVRVLYCKSAMDEVLDRSNCSRLEQPPRTKACRVPCPSDCVVSEWSDWGACSRSCGKRGGVQMRTRQILAYADPEHSSCLPEDELSQTRVCNEDVWCRSYMWQVGPWQVCQSSEHGLCGEKNGTQTRTVTCEKDTGVPVEEHHCDAASKPDSARLCNVSCPVDCVLSVWTGWSICSQTCGEGYRYKTQRILQLPAHGGTQCPAKADKNGIITKRGRCRDLPPCYSYEWQSVSWSDCTVLDDQCGPGYQTRDVVCQRSDGVTVDHGVCLEHLLSARPPSHRSCHMPCAGDCLLSEWSSFTPCSQTCGDTPGVMVRYRRITTRGPTNNIREQCPHISDRDLQEKVSCYTNPCPSYRWDVGEWTSCILHSDDENLGHGVCGSGVQRRSVLCLRDDGQHVGREQCDGVSLMPDVHRPCNVECPQDCRVSEWSDWRECSQACGAGVKERIRTIVIPARNGGSICPPTTEKAVCLNSPCEIFEWQVHEWSVCTLPADVSCGVGIQTRDVICPAGQSLEEQCQLVKTKPDASRSCELPCPGDCVMSSWSEFSDCSEPCPVGGVKSRSREIIRQPSAEGERCGEEVEFVQCNKEPCVTLSYAVVLGEWADCQLVSGDCGRGYRQRPINCVRSDGVVVSPSNCQDFDVTLSIEPCGLECSEDCILSDYSDWSMCSHRCGMVGRKTRSRTVENPSKHLGRPCQHELTQTTPCNVKPCHQYEWHRSEWSQCSVANGGCGFGEKTRTVECRRSDGHVVDDVLCILQGDHYSDLTDLQKLTGSLNKTDLDLETTIHVPCGSACPGDCQVSEWSDFSPCFSTCNYDNSGWTVRSRYVTQRQAEGGEPCPEDLLEVKTCPLSEAMCPKFVWQASDWNDLNGLRDVWCQLDGFGVNVTGGCADKHKPSTASECQMLCDEPFTECQDGQCRCQPGMTRIGEQCYPNAGCMSDEHCMFEHSYCDDAGRCVCEDDYVLYNGVGPCIRKKPARGTTTAPSLSNNILPVEKDSSSHTQTDKNGDLWKYVAIAVGGCLAVVLAVLIAVIVIMRRKRSSNHGEVKTTANTVEFKHNNLDVNNYNKLNEKLSNLGKDAILSKC